MYRGRWHGIAVGHGNRYTAIRAAIADGNAVRHTVDRGKWRHFDTRLDGR